MTYTQKQFDSLPKWAQAAIKSARVASAIAAYMKKEAQAFEDRILDEAALAVLDGVGGAEANAWRGDIVAVRDPYDHKIPVARARDHVRFYVENGSIDVSVRDGRLHLNALGGNEIFIKPNVSNDFSVILTAY